ncbi:MAG: cysteine--tRNA ligase [Desulfosalsimonadaceae bacterium]|nr:cysteine--tRNA ligase [Desulfosalsimonadaceae bacterium]
MTLTIYNSLNRSKEPFETIDPGKVKMYVCGPTVYDSCHIGHARSIIVFDVIFRYLTFAGYDVTYVRNFTDIDDKIINRAGELGMSPAALAEKYIQEFYVDMDALNVLRPTEEPRATEHIGNIIRLIEILVEKGVAYAAGGDVFFSVDLFDGYGKLSGRKLDDMEAGARVEVDLRKKNPFDFVLWKASKPGEPEWDSPWGKGRPGWHIECSAMSKDLLGASLDIHGGGKDLIFPHHENEIAQSEAAFGKTFVKYWVHNGFVNINHEKMSKSLGNFLMIKDILKTYHPEVVRLFLLSHHYRSPVDFSDETVRNTAAGLDKIYAVLERVEKFLGRLPDIGADRYISSPDAEKDLWVLFTNAMNDDFNTAQGIGVLYDAVRNLNKMLDSYEKAEAEHPDNAENRRTISNECLGILKIGNILGILCQPPGDYFARKKEAVLERQSVDPGLIEALIQERKDARKSKDFKKADEIRDRLKSMNIEIEDRPEGTVWKVMT